MFLHDKDAFEDWKNTHLEWDQLEESALHVEVRYGLTSLAELLLGQDGIVMDAHPKSGIPLQVARFAPNRLEMLRLLLSHGAEPNFKMENNEPTVFHEWPCEGELEYDCVVEFLRYGASCSASPFKGMNALHHFASHGSDPRILDLLLDNPEDKGNCADLQSVDEDERTPLHWLLARDKIPIELLEAFIARGADVNPDDKSSKRPLFDAAENEEIEAVRLIIGKVTEVDDDDDYGSTALHAAAWCGQLDVVKVLLEHGADSTRRDSRNRTPFFFACACFGGTIPEREATANYLLEHLLKEGRTLAEINVPTKRGRTPLRETAAHGFEHITKTLINMMEPHDNETINRVNSFNGRGPLYSAARHGKADMAELLLQYGADPKLRDGRKADGKTALEIYYEQWVAHGSDEYQATLCQLIPWSPEEAIANRSLLATAIMEGSKPVLLKLLEVKAEFTQPDQYGWTPYLLARHYQQKDALEFLHEKVFGPTRWDSHAETAGTTVSASGLEITHTGEETFCLTTNNPIAAGKDRYYFELEISTLDQHATDTNEALSTRGQQAPQPWSIALGFSTAEGKWLAFPGWHSPRAPRALSWAWHSDDGKLYHMNRTLARAETFGFGDTAGAGVDFANRLVFFTKNGRKLEGCYHRGVKGRLFLALGLADRHEKTVLVTNFRLDPDRPLRWNWPGEGEQHEDR